ncbi:MAG: peptidylprolyl isomerase [Anaerolineaceae bacterium]|nr:peptidylprolyl isomerase [Anaerolineaceae bacterium]
MAKPSRKIKVTNKNSVVRKDKEKAQRKTLMSFTFGLVLLIVGIIGYGLLDQLVIQKAKPVATISGEKIKVDDFQDRVTFTRWYMIQSYMQNLELYIQFANDPNFANMFKPSLQDYQTKLDPAFAPILAEDILDNMIDDVIILKEADRLGIELTQSELESYLQEQYRYYPEGSPTPTLTPTIALESTLSPAQLAVITATPAAQPTEVVEDAVEEAPAEDVEPTPTLEPQPTATEFTLDSYESLRNEYFDIVKDETGLPADYIYEYLRVQILREKVYQELTKDMQPFETQVWARHILVGEEEQAEFILGRLESGEDWNVIAAEVSLDESNKDAGGDLGWFNSERMVTPFTEAAFNLEIGEISSPVETDFGWHIIQVLGHEDRSLKSYDFDSKKESFFANWITEMKALEEIEKIEGWENFVPAQPVIPPQSLIDLSEE